MHAGAAPAPAPAPAPCVVELHDRVCNEPRLRAASPISQLGNWIQGTSGSPSLKAARKIEAMGAEPVWVAFSVSATLPDGTERPVVRTTM